MRIQVAYQVLSDPDQRATYDRIYPAPAEKHLPVSLSTHYSRSQVPRLDESQLVYTILDLTVAANESKQSKLPLNICLVIDRSTSMQGERLETVKKAAISLLRQFRREVVLDHRIPPGLPLPHQLGHSPRGPCKGA